MTACFEAAVDASSRERVRRKAGLPEFAYPEELPNALDNKEKISQPLSASV